jgi:hypothetical protein
MLAPEEQLQPFSANHLARLDPRRSEGEMATQN